MLFSPSVQFLFFKFIAGKKKAMVVDEEQLKRTDHWVVSPSLSLHGILMQSPFLCFPLHFRNKVCAGNVKTFPLTARCLASDANLPVLCSYFVNIVQMYLEFYLEKRIKWVIKFFPVNIYIKIYIFQSRISRHSFSIQIVSVSFLTGAAALGSDSKCSISKHSVWSIWYTAVP